LATLSRDLVPSRPKFRRSVLAVAVAAALATGGVACGGDEGPAGSEAVDAPSEAGDCLRPDAERAGGFLQAACDAADASVEVTAVVPADDDAATPGPACPGGTDVVVDARQGPVRDGEIEGPALVWCLRNLDGPHPGDPGQGGGEVVPEDCFRLEDDGAVQEVRCGGAPYRVLAWASRTEDCPPETAEPIELATTPPEVVCAATTEAATTTATTPPVPPPTDPPRP
jgi:hypothetical protein